MKRIIIKIILALNFLGGQYVFASSGYLFHVTADYPLGIAPSALVLTINTTIPNWIYQSSGIKILSSEYHLMKSDTGCTSSGNGYCLFSVSDTFAAHIQVSTPTSIMAPPPQTPFKIVLCLNAIDNPVNCEQHLITPVMPE